MSDIARIMATDPLKLTKEDVGAVVAEFRASLHLFKTNPGAAKPAKAAKPSAVAKAGITLSLDDLGI